MTYLSMTRGDDTEFTVTAVDASGDPLDLTGADLRFTAKYSALDADDAAVLSKTTGAGIELDADPTTGIAVITIEPDDTTDLTKAVALWWDVQAVDMAGAVKTIASGRLRVGLDVSQTAP